MAINKNGVDENAVEQAIATALEQFYGSLLEKIDEIRIEDIMKRKNPYLYRAKAMQNASEIVESVLSATVSSSEETIFGNCFFEPLAIAASGGNKALAEGVDIMVHDQEQNTIYAIAVKSGPSVFNADSNAFRFFVTTYSTNRIIRPIMLHLTAFILYRNVASIPTRIDDVRRIMLKRIS